MTPLISVIIPCYNHGEYLGEAIESVEKNAYTGLYEIIIVNDGSTDLNTISKLNSLKQQGYNVINQANQGLANARNNAIKIARGKYIIPLDSDNKLHKNYFNEALDILEKDSSIDVVYGAPMFFGSEDGIRNIGEFQFKRIINGNYIDACAVYKKQIWDKVNGYDPNMPAMGHEDWEFWINTCISGGVFYYLDKLCFYYRSLPNSMAKMISTPNEALNKKYIHAKHCEKIISKFIEEQNENNNKLKNISNYLKSHKLKSIIKILLGHKF